MYVAGKVSGCRIYHELQTELMLTWINFAVSHTPAKKYMLTSKRKLNKANASDTEAPFLDLHLSV